MTDHDGLADFIEPCLPAASGRQPGDGSVLVGHPASGLRNSTQHKDPVRDGEPPRAFDSARRLSAWGSGSGLAATDETPASRKTKCN